MSEEEKRGLDEYDVRAILANWRETSGDLDEPELVAVTVDFDSWYVAFDDGEGEGWTPLWTMREYATERDRRLGAP